MYFTSQGSGRLDARGGGDDHVFKVTSTTMKKEPAAEKRLQYQQNKTMFPNVSTHRRGGGGGHATLQQSLSAEGYLEPTVSGVTGDSKDRLSVGGGGGGAWQQKSPFLRVRSVSAETSDEQYAASLADRHSYHGSSRAIGRDASPDPPRNRSPSPYSSAHPPPPPLRTSPSLFTQQAPGTNRDTVKRAPPRHAQPQAVNAHAPASLHADYKEVRENMVEKMTPASERKPRHSRVS